MEPRKFKINDKVIAVKNVNEYINNYNKDYFESGNFYTHVNMICEDERKNYIKTTNGNHIFGEDEYLHASEVKSYILRKLAEKIVYVSEFDFK